MLVCTAALASVESYAQTSVPAQQTLIPAQVPLNDTDCGNLPFYQTGVPPCTVIGTRTVTEIGPVTFPSGVPGTSYHVEFDGKLQTYGLPTALSPTDPVPFQVPSSAFFPPLQTVDVTGSYTGDWIKYDIPGLPAPTGDPAILVNLRDISLTVNRIDVDYNLSGAYDPVTGQEYEFSLRSIDPTAIVSNSTALTGRYNSSTGAIVFGHLSGTATLIANPTVTPANSFYENLGYYSPFALQYQVTAVETTRLDENGLTTPRIAVSEGIDMNGSVISDLAPGVAPGDAVNRAQLDAEAQARAQAVLQVNQRIDAESVARAALVTRMDAIGGRLDQIDGRIDRLERRVASGTAIASALSGNAFLPDMKFNLTANVATYDGAHAGALQMGVIASRHVAVNAGVATGFNRRGKTAARAGLTIGW